MKHPFRVESDHAMILPKVINKQGEGIVLDIVPGIVGVLLGGWVFATFGEMALRASVCRA